MNYEGPLYCGYNEIRKKKIFFWLKKEESKKGVERNYLKK